MKKILLVAACLSTAIAATSVFAQASAGAGTISPGDQDVSQIDRTFASQAGAANLAEVQLGQLAASQGASPAVKDFGNRMVNDHTEANASLSNILAEKHVGVAGEPNLEQQKTISSMQGLSGAAFDQRYARQAVKDHEQAIQLFTQEAAQGADPQLRTFAAHTLPTLKEHLRMAKALPNGTM